MTHNGSTLPFLDTDDPDAERHTASPTAHLLAELALYGYRPGQDEPDPRPLPEPDSACRQLEAAVDALDAMLTGTRLEDDLADLLWSFVNLFHRKIDRIEAELDRNEQAQRRSQTEQDGSEVKSVELERLIDEGKSLIERRNAFEFFRDHAAELFESATGSAWRPLAGSMVNRRALTAAMIDSREFIAARRRADAEVLAPSGPRIAFTGGADCNDHRRIWDTLDKVRAKHPDMVLCTAAARAAPSASPPAGPTIAKCRRSSSSPIGPGTGTPHPSSATTACSKRCRSASSYSPAPASPPTSPTRRRTSVFRCGEFADDGGEDRETAPRRRRSRSMPTAAGTIEAPPEVCCAAISLPACGVCFRARPCTATAAARAKPR